MRNFIAIDFETANPSYDSACQIGISNFMDGQFVEMKSWYINPRQYFHSFNKRLHGITEETVKDAPAFDELWPEIKHYFDLPDGGFVVAHYSAFDIKVLRSCLMLHDLEYPSFRILCTRAVARRTWPNEPTYRLEDLCKKYEIEYGNHDAGEDSKSCGELLLKAAKTRELNCTSIYQYEELSNIFKVFFGELSHESYLPSKCKDLPSKPKQKFQPVVIVGDPEKIDPESPFYGKNVVFTGSLDGMIRKEAAQIVADKGGIPQNGINRDTNYLVVGQQDYRVVGESGMSGKQIKAIKLIADGQDLEVISESDFYEMI